MKIFLRIALAVSIVFLVWLSLLFFEAEEVQARTVEECLFKVDREAALSGSGGSTSHEKKRKECYVDITVEECLVEVDKGAAMRGTFDSDRHQGAREDCYKYEASERSYKFNSYEYEYTSSSLIDSTGNPLVETLFVFGYDSENSNIQVFRYEKDDSFWFISYGGECEPYMTEEIFLFANFSNFLAEIDRSSTKLSFPSYITSSGKTCYVKEAYQFFGVTTFEGKVKGFFLNLLEEEKESNPQDFIDYLNDYISDDLFLLAFEFNDGRVLRYVVEFAENCSALNAAQKNKTVYFNLEGTDFNGIGDDYVVFPSKASKCDVASAEPLNLFLSDFDYEAYIEKKSKGSEGNSFFYDVSVGHKNYEAILYLKNEGVISGYPDGSFKPAKSVNRAELMKILVEGKVGTPDPELYKNCFPDIQTLDTQWFAPYICYAKKSGWVDGYPDGLFRPGQTVNKVEALKMLLNSQEISVTKNVTQKPFEDVEISGWFAPYVAKAKELELLEETGDLLKPGEKMSRAGISENLYRVLTMEYKKEKTENETLHTEKYITIKYRDEGEVDIGNPRFEHLNTSTSSFIRGAWYDSNNQYMVINLNGTYYHYCGMPSTVWNSFKLANSFGTHYNTSIKGSYDCRINFVPSY